MEINRREFMLMAGSGLLLAGHGQAYDEQKETYQGRKAQVSLIRTSDRAEGVKRALQLLGINPVKGMDVLVKPNFNTADPFPASTHNDTLRHLILRLKDMGAESITIGERSGPPDTAGVLKEKGIYDLSKRLDVGLINFEELPPEGWIRTMPKHGHWLRGFDVAKPVLDSKCIVTTCCLKTHGYGGVFTMSLKLSVGIVHKRNMAELHSSFRSMGKMIAEINEAYNPSLILMDGIEAFVDGGPMRGTKKRADVILGATDRIAMDAVGLSVLKELGSNREIMQKAIFKQEQMVRAVELSLGVKGPEDIEILTDDEDGKRYADRLMPILLRG